LKNGGFVTYRFVTYRFVTYRFVIYQGWGWARPFFTARAIGRRILTPTSGWNSVWTRSSIVERRPISPLPCW